MGKPYSENSRERVVAYAASGHSARAASRVFGVSASTAVRLVSAHRHTGTVAAKRQGRADVGKGRSDIFRLLRSPTYKLRNPKKNEWLRLSAFF